MKRIIINIISHNNRNKITIIKIDNDEIPDDFGENNFRFVVFDSWFWIIIHSQWIFQIINN